MIAMTYSIDFKRMALMRQTLTRMTFPSDVESQNVVKRVGMILINPIFIMFRFEQ